MKIWSPANFSYNIFRPIQNNLHVGSVCSLVHPTLHSYDIILNVTISNFGCLGINASLSSDNTGPWPPCISCGEIRSSICFKTVSQSSTLFRNISLNAYRSSTLSSFIMLWKEPNWCLHFIHSRVLPRRGFSSSEFTSIDSILVKACLSPSLIWHRMKECMDLHVGWNMLDDTYKQ